MTSCQGKVKSKNSRSNKKLLYFAIHLSKCVNISPEIACTAGRLTKQAGQVIIVFTRDQQLYRVAVNISWAQPGSFHNYGKHLGGMLFLMSFIGCVRSLMAERGLVDILSCAFGGVDHMFTGNKSPHNFRALRLIVEAVIQNTVHEANDDVDMIPCL